jgi:queuine tRNA-ribosyltransferase
VLRLLSLHNLHWYGEIVAGARSAIAEGRYAAWARAVTSELEAGVV